MLNRYIFSLSMGVCKLGASDSCYVNYSVWSNRYPLGSLFMGINLSMFSIIGLIGMTGIIINDSIVLVSTIDEYSKNRGLKPAIVDAICITQASFANNLNYCFRFNATPFETSKDAQFLKPTIVTLVYGLGFGMLIVLF